ncbi:Cutinase transcription factor 1 beta [Talaromyces islandicus]|uniref:Cutinase transcription factor 1 beta n=1 Tax=Talaromyces islandicus TaxID=28573 RepID=A0A0U1M6K8_TALIS|nr:Cutinase transcription factor 1 beta [Talaromyces islandicus]
MRNRPTPLVQKTPTNTRQRAKRACTECNARRVRCDVVQTQPCSNCQSSGVKCEVVPSRRGRYPRKSREQRASAGTSVLESHSNNDHIDSSLTPAQTVQASPPHTGSSDSVDPEAASSHYVPTPERGNTFFFGESNLLTYVTGPPPGNGPVRELQSSSSLGLPRRIRDEDCDIEPLTAGDLEEEYDGSIAPSFGRCEPEHVVYVLKMTHIARLLGKIVDIQFAPKRQYGTTTEDLETAKQELEEWKDTLPIGMRPGASEGNIPVWSSLLHLSYNHLRILIHRNGFLRNQRARDDRDKQAATAAANQISRIAEDMLSQQTIQYGQMHLITGLFAALCIHVINIRTTDGVNKRLAENRAQICLLGLHEIQKYWRVNNLVLDFFFQYLDDSTARILLAADTERQGFGKSSAASSVRHPDNLTESEGPTVTHSAVQITPQANPMPFPSSTADTPGPPEDQYWNFVRMNWDGDDNNPTNSDLGFLWDAQLYANLDFLEKCI